MIDKLDECIILLAQLLLQNPVVLCPHVVRPLLAHLLADERHLLQREDRLVLGGHGLGRARGGRGLCVVGEECAGGGAHGRGVVHHGLGAGGRAAAFWDLLPLPQPLELVPEV